MRNVARDKIIGLHRNGRQEKEKCKIVTGYLLLVLFDEIEEFRDWGPSEVGYATAPYWNSERHSTPVR
jgi:AAA+ superfamily predicted ATPase